MELRKQHKAQVIGSAGWSCIMWKEGRESYQKGWQKKNEVL